MVVRTILLCAISAAVQFQIVAQCETWLESPRKDEAEMRQGLHQIIDNIRDGKFARDWMLEQQAGFPVFKRIRKENMNHPMRLAERLLYKVLGRIQDDEE